MRTDLKLTARSYAIRLNSPNVAEIDPDRVLSLAADALERPSDSAWWDDELYETHTLMFATPDWSLTSDYIVGQANYRAILADMSDAYKRHPGAVSDASFGHWTYSRFVAVKVRVCYADGTIHPAFVDAVTIADCLERDYPLYSEETHSELESEVWDYTVGEAIADARRDAEYSDLEDIRNSEEWETAFREAISDFYCYSGADYIADEHTESARAIADDIVTRARETGIPVNTSGDTLPGLGGSL